jgi:glutathione peroxidase
MRSLTTIILCLLSITELACKGTLLDHNFKKLASSEEVNLCEAYSGKVVLVVNTASKCGFTYQYEGLMKNMAMKVW